MLVMSKHQQCLKRSNRYTVLTTTLHHWFSLSGRSLWDFIHLANDGYITVSLVGRIAIGSAKSDCPDFVTQAT